MLKIAEDPMGHHIRLDLYKNIKYVLCISVSLYERETENYCFHYCENYHSVRRVYLLQLPKGLSWRDPFSLTG